AKKHSRKRRMPRRLRRIRSSALNQNRLSRGRACASRGKAHPLAAILCFIRNSSPTAPGWRQAITATFGNRARRKARAAGGRTRPAAGFTPMLVGLGFPKNHLVGPLITTDAGRGYAVSVGFGFRVMIGPRPGFRGARAMITSAGHRFRRKRDSISALAFITGPIVITTSVRISILL